MTSKKTNSNPVRRVQASHFICGRGECGNKRGPLSLHDKGFFPREGVG